MELRPITYDIYVSDNGHVYRKKVHTPNIRIYNYFEYQGSKFVRVHEFKMDRWNCPHIRVMIGSKPTPICELVVLAFCGINTTKSSISHIDGDLTNNTLSNLKVYVNPPKTSKKHYRLAA